MLVHSVLFSVLGLAASSLAQSTTSASTSAAASSVSSQTSSSAATNVATSLLPVPTSGPSFSNDTARTLAPSLPGYTYNLTSEPLATRNAICQQTTQFCASSRCTTSQANVTVNFCNPETMGWNCECNDKAQSRLQPVIVPVNSYDCRLRTQACLQACENRMAAVPVPNVGNCRNACNYVIGSTCGTAAQFIPQYQVDKEDATPRYYPDTSKGGVAPGLTVSAGFVKNAPISFVFASVLAGVVMLL